MKKSLIAALVVTQGWAPAAAADLVATGAEGSRIGAFAGARLRVSLDGARRDRVRAGIAMSPTMHDLRRDGSARLAIGEGIEYGFSPGRTPELSFAGQPVRELVGREGQDRGRQNISTLGWVAVGLGAAAVAYFAWFMHEMNDCDPHDDEC